MWRKTFSVGLILFLQFSELFSQSTDNDYREQRNKGISAENIYKNEAFEDTESHNLAQIVQSNTKVVVNPDIISIDPNSGNSYSHVDNIPNAVSIGLTVGVAVTLTILVICIVYHCCCKKQRPWIVPNSSRVERVSSVEQPHSATRVTLQHIPPSEESTPIHHPYHPVQQLPLQYEPVQPLPPQYEPVQQLPPKYEPVQQLPPQYQPVQQQPSYPGFVTGHQYSLIQTQQLPASYGFQHPAGHSSPYGLPPY